MHKHVTALIITAAIAAARPVFDPIAGLFDLDQIPPGIAINADTTKGYGATIAQSATLGGSYTNVAQVRDIEEGGVTAEEVDTSHMASPNQHKEKESDWLNSENVTFDSLYTKAQHATALGLVGVMKYWKLTTADGSVSAFQGFISKIGRAIPMNGRISANMEITITGAQTFTPAA